MVNDGSNDNGEELCRQYLKKDSRFVCLSQAHSGVSAARNLGMKYAKGDWIIFVDADDLLNPYIAQIIEENGKDAYELILWDSEIFTESPVNKFSQINVPLGTISEREIEIISGLQLLERVCSAPNTALNQQLNLYSSWGKAYRAAFLREKGCTFPHKIAIGEDLLFNLLVYGANPKTAYISRVLSYYWKNPNSVTHSYNPDILRINDRFHSQLIRILESLNLRNRYQKYIDYSVVNGMLADFEFYIFNPSSKMSMREQRNQFLMLVKNSPYADLMQGKSISEWFSPKKKIAIFLAKHRCCFLLKLLYAFYFMRK